MIECPQCKEHELVGAVFCRRCGTQLIVNEAGAISIPPMVNPSVDGKLSINFKEPGFKQTNPSLEPDKRPSDNFQNYPPPRPSQAIKNPETEVNERIALQVIQTGEIIPIMEEDEVTLGRAGTGQPIVPDIDLTPYQGLEAGVSRLHASIRIRGNEVYIMDLGSANGTRLNGEKLSPSTPHKLANEAVITLGKLKLKVLIKS